MTTAPLGEALLAAVCLWIVHFKLTRGLDEQLEEVRRRGASERGVRVIGWSYCFGALDLDRGSRVDARCSARADGDRAHRVIVKLSIG
jgi:hypothetical protein